MALPNPNRHLGSGDALGRAKLTERFAEHPEELQAVFGDVVFPRDAVDDIMDGAAVQQATSSFKPWRSRGVAAPSAVVAEQAPAEKPVDLQGRYEAMTPEQRLAHREALMSAEIETGDVTAIPEEEDFAYTEEVDPWA